MTSVFVSRCRLTIFIVFIISFILRKDCTSAVELLFSLPLHWFIDNLNNVTEACLLFVNNAVSQTAVFTPFLSWHCHCEHDMHGLTFTCSRAYACIPVLCCMSVSSFSFHCTRFFYWFKGAFLKHLVPKIESAAVRISSQHMLYLIIHDGNKLVAQYSPCEKQQVTSMVSLKARKAYRKKMRDFKGPLR